jgi:hypothetical protein
MGLNEKYENILLDRGIETTEPITSVVAKYFQYPIIDYVIPSSYSLGVDGFTIKYTTIYHMEKIVTIGSESFSVDEADFPVVETFSFKDVMADPKHKVFSGIDLTDEAKTEINTAVERVLKNMGRLEQCNIAGMNSPDASNNSLLQKAEKKARRNIDRGLEVLNSYFKYNRLEEDKDLKLVPVQSNLSNKEFAGFVKTFMRNQYSS